MSTVYHQSPNQFFNSFTHIIDSKKKINKRKFDIEQKYSRFYKKMEILCYRYLYEFLSQELTGKPFITASDILEQLEVSTDQQSFLSSLINILIDKKIMNVDHKIIKWNSDIVKSKNFEIQHKNLTKDFPHFSGTIALLVHCVYHYPLVLRGKIPSISVLYPKGNQDFLNTILSNNTEESTHINFFKDVVIDFIENLDGKRNIDILEVGGGRGLFTRKILPDIQDNPLITYHFTDLGRQFVMDMDLIIERNEYKSIKCSQFDITKIAKDQGIRNQHYDLIIALDVVHATPNITESLKNLKMLLSDQGCLCVFETTKVPIWEFMIVGMTKGWWLFQDECRTTSPLVPAKVWKEVLLKSGFDYVHLVEGINNGNESALIIASK